jgi:translation initiation factor 3 subunit A
MKASLRLLWEAYRTIIENVKLNERMENIYFEVVRKLADYCLQYKRKAEFQWFSDQINKYDFYRNFLDTLPN